MASIYKEISISIEPQNVWEAVRDVENVHKRLVQGYASSALIDGDTRILTMTNGNIVKELIISIDDYNYRLAYTVMESQMRLLYHHASFQVIPEEKSSGKLDLPPIVVPPIELVSRAF